MLFHTQRGAALYHIKRRIEELDTPFGDGSHIVYANGAYTLTVTEPIPDHVHSYEAADWMTDPSSGDTYAVLTCACGDTVFVKADVTSEITKEAAPGVEGEITYTAAAEYDGEIYVSSWTEALPALSDETADEAETAGKAEADVAETADEDEADADETADEGEADADETQATLGAKTADRGTFAYVLLMLLAAAVAFGTACRMRHAE